MNKAEEFVEAYLKKSKFDDDIIEYSIILDMMDEYAQQVSKKNDFEKWIKELIELDSNLSFLTDGYQTGEIFEWHDWWINSVTTSIVDI